MVFYSVCIISIYIYIYIYIYYVCMDMCTCILVYIYTYIHNQGHISGANGNNNIQFTTSKLTTSKPVGIRNLS